VAFTVEYSTQELAAELELVRSQIRAGTPSAVRAFGAQILECTRRDYKTMSTGGRTVDGRHWQPLKRSTVATRVYSGSGRSAVDQRHALALQIARLRGKGAAEQAASLRRQREDLERGIQSQIDQGMSSERIGVVSGRLEASAEVTYDGNVLSLSYANPAAAFGAKRSIIPVPIARSWIEAAANAVRKSYQSSMP